MRLYWLLVAIALLSTCAVTVVWLHSCPENPATTSNLKQAIRLQKWKKIAVLNAESNASTNFLSIICFWPVAWHSAHLHISTWQLQDINCLVAWWWYSVSAQQNIACACKSSLHRRLRCGHVFDCNQRCLIWWHASLCHQASELGLNLWLKRRLHHTQNKRNKFYHLYKTNWIICTWLIW